MGRKKVFVCPNCEKRLKKDELVWFPDVEGDESGLYVVYVGYCPNCREEVTREFGYKAPDYDEPLRWET